MDFKISIITPSYNQGEFIRDTIESVLRQNLDNIEHIIIDGGSTDHTLEILKQYPHLKWISEKDNGPSDAITKGIEMANGNIIGWINSDDYLTDNALSDVLFCFKNENAKIIVGDMILINLENEVIYESRNHEIYNIEHLIKVNPDIIKQPSTFFDKELFYSVGGFDKSLKLIFDYDLFVKMFKIHKPVLVPKFLSYQRIYDGTLTRSSLRRQAVEIFRISRKHGAKLSDKVIFLAFKRFLIPSIKTDKPSKTLQIIRRIKNYLKLGENLNNTL